MAVLELNFIVFEVGPISFLIDNSQSLNLLHPCWQGWPQNRAFRFGDILFGGHKAYYFSITDLGQKGLEPVASLRSDSRPTPHKAKTQPLAGILALVRMKGLEPSRLSALVPKTSVSTIPPHPHVGD